MSHTVRLVLVDDDEGTIELGENGEQPTEFSTKSGRTYSLPDVCGCKPEAVLMNVIARFMRDKSFGVPKVRKVYADRAVIESMYELDDLCSKHTPYMANIDFSGQISWSRGAPRGSALTGVTCYTPDGGVYVRGLTPSGRSQGSGG